MLIAPVSGAFWTPNGLWRRRRDGAWISTGRVSQASQNDEMHPRGEDDLGKRTGLYQAIIVLAISPGEHAERLD